MKGGHNVGAARAPAEYAVDTNFQQHEEAIRVLWP